MGSPLTNAQSFAFISGGLFCIIEALKALETMALENQADEAMEAEPGRQPEDSA